MASQSQSIATAPAPAQRSAAVQKLNFPLHPAGATHAGTHVARTAPGADAGSIGGAVFSLMLVVGLILALGWLAKRMPGMQRGAGTSQMKVVASLSLGPRERAVVIDVGGTQLLLGVGAGGVRTLHRLDQPLAIVETPVASPFAQVLAQQFGRKA